MYIHFDHVGVQELCDRKTKAVLIKGIIEYYIMSFHSKRQPVPSQLTKKEKVVNVIHRAENKQMWI